MIGEKKRVFGDKTTTWGFRAQMAAELFGDPAWARTVPTRMASNVSGNKEHAYYVLSETMVRYLDQPAETGTDLFRAYQDACALAVRGKETRERALCDPATADRFGALQIVTGKPIGSALYLDFLRLLWRYAPETGRSSETMITALGQRYGLKRRSVYSYIEQAEAHFVRTLRAWHEQRTKLVLLADIARVQARARHALDKEAGKRVPAPVVLDGIAARIGDEKREREETYRLAVGAAQQALALAQQATQEEEEERQGPDDAAAMADEQDEQTQERALSATAGTC